MPHTLFRKMKNKASILLKKITSILSVIAKAKSAMAINTKFSATKGRLLMLSMVKSKKLLLTSLSHKIHSAILGQHDDDDNEDDDHSKAIVLYNAATAHANQYQLSASMTMAADEEEDNDKYPDLTHSLFDDDYDIDDAKLQAAGGSIIDMMRNSKVEGEEFKLEEEIDEAADLFIKRFRKQIRMQKLESFKRLQEMLARGT